MAILTADKLRAYNRALYHLGARQLASLSENREPRRVLDHIWGPNNEAIELALERAGWNFAMRAQQLTLDESLEPEFGWTYVFQKPTDYVRLEALSADPRFINTLDARSYADEAGYWLADHPTLYVKYVSNDDDYGFDSALWPESFKEYIAAYLAFQSCERLTQSLQKKDYLGGEMMRALALSKSRDSMDEGTKFPQRGSWVRSRGGGTRNDRGLRSELIGE